MNAAAASGSPEPSPASKASSDSVHITRVRPPILSGTTGPGPLRDCPFPIFLARNRGQGLARSVVRSPGITAAAAVVAGALTLGGVLSQAGAFSSPPAGHGSGVTGPSAPGSGSGTSGGGTSGGGTSGGGYGY